MLFSLYDSRGLTLQAADGPIGSVEDFYFDDTNWSIRYAVVDTGKWLPGRRVLLSPEAFESVDVARREFRTALTRESVKNAPPVETDRPVSRQQELLLHNYYGWAPYWGMVGPVAAQAPVAAGQAYATPGLGAAAADPQFREAVKREQEEADPHLRSGREVTGYHILARDGGIGHVEDILGDDRAWKIRYVIVDTVNWLPGKKVLISPRWVSSIDWNERSAAVDLSRDQVRSSPEFDRSQLPDRENEAKLFSHYGRPPYWL